MFLCHLRDQFTGCSNLKVSHAQFKLMIHRGHLFYKHCFCVYRVNDLHKMDSTLRLFINVEFDYKYGMIHFTVMSNKRSFGIYTEFYLSLRIMGKMRSYRFLHIFTADFLLFLAPAEGSTHVEHS